MPNTIVFANKQLVLQKQKLAALKAAALQKQKAKAKAALQKQKLAATAALQKQKLAATAALQKQNIPIKSTPIILSVASDYVSVPGVVSNQNTKPDLNKINISVSSVYVPAI